MSTAEHVEEAAREDQLSREGIDVRWIHPPIPIRAYDWQATRKGYEPGDRIGRGATELEAIDDLLAQESDDE